MTSAVAGTICAVIIAKTETGTPLVVHPVPQLYLLPVGRELARELSDDRDAGRDFVLGTFGDHSRHTLWHVADTTITAVSCAAPAGLLGSPLPMPALGAQLDIEVTLEVPTPSSTPPLIDALKRVGRSGGRNRLATADPSKWAAGLLSSAGFDPVALTVADLYYSARGATRMWLADVIAAVTVTDAAGAYRALGHGVGEGRAHGAGLIRIADLP